MNEYRVGGPREPLYSVLLNSDELVSLYRTNVFFRHGIDSLIALIPLMVESVKNQSFKDEEQRQRAIQFQLSRPVMSDTFPEWVIQNADS